MAIKFIYDNADKIGGDRNRITIGGESAGSISSSFQMLTPETSQYVNQGWFYRNVTYLDHSYVIVSFGKSIKSYPPVWNA